MMRTCSCCSAGKTSMMRSIVDGALCVCSVAKTRWPVSAAVSAVEIVSRSRISPTRMMSGSWRSAALSALPKLVASGPISRWLTMQRLCLCTNSIGSSTVRMCSERVRLISSMIAASVVDLPEPVGPVTRTRPRGFSAKMWRIAGSWSSSSVLISVGMRRKAAPTRLPLVVHVHAEAGDARERVREVELAVQLELLLLLAREDAVQQPAGVVRAEGLEAGGTQDLPAHAVDGRAVRRDVQVRRVQHNHLLEQLVDGRQIRHSLPRIGTRPGRLEEWRTHPRWGIRIPRLGLRAGEPRRPIESEPSAIDPVLEGAIRNGEQDQDSPGS